MEIILIKDVPNLGSLGDTVQVKPGYGRNYLIPKGMALLAKGKESKELRHRLEYLKKLREGKIELAKEQALKLKKLDLEVIRKAGPEGKLFGSVNNRDIDELLREKKFDFGRKAIVINAPIRKVGTHEFTIRIHSEVSQSMKIRVIGDTEIIDQPEKLNDDSNKIESDDSIDNSDSDKNKKNIDTKQSKEDKASEEKLEVRETQEPKEIKKTEEKQKKSKAVKDSEAENPTKESQELKENNKKKENKKISKNK